MTFRDNVRVFRACLDAMELGLHEISADLYDKLDPWFRRLLIIGLIVQASLFIAAMVWAAGVKIFGWW